MGLVTNINWSCPGCCELNYSQAYDSGFDEPANGFHHSSVPIHYAMNLKWNQPCKKCGQYKLHEPVTSGQRINMGFEKIEPSTTKESENVSS